MSKSGRTSLRSSPSVWFRAVRVFSFTTSLTPVLLGAVLALGAADVRWELAPLVALGCALIHAGTNLVSDAADYRRGVDRPGTHGSSAVPVEGLSHCGGSVRRRPCLGPQSDALGSDASMRAGVEMGLPAIRIPLAGNHLPRCLGRDDLRCVPDTLM